MRTFDTVEEATLDRLTADGERLWLDLVAPDAATLDRLAERLDWHPLALADAKGRAQRPKLHRYGEQMSIVFYGAETEPGPGTAPDDRDVGPTPRPASALHPRLLKVCLIVGGCWVVTVRDRPNAALDQLRAELDGDRSADDEPSTVYRILDVLTDSFFPVLDAIDDAIDGIEEAIMVEGGRTELREVFHLKRTLLELRRIVAPQRDLAQRTIELVGDLPGLAPNARDYYRDLYDHLIRVSETVDTYRDLLTGAIDISLSSSSNRMNAVMKQLTVVATIFLPVTALTGFFGMNFGWMVREIETLWSFLLFGVGGALFAAAVLMVWFKRARFFD